MPAPMDHKPVVSFVGGMVSTCIDCGTPTYCNRAHGGDHDHSPEAVECTRRAREQAAAAGEQV